jgi:hypothetical protein
MLAHRWRWSSAKSRPRYGHPAPAVAAAAEQTHLRLDDRGAAGHRAELLDQAEDRRRVEVVEHPEAQDHVEVAEALARDLAQVGLHDLQPVGEAERIARERGLGDVGLAAVEGDDLRAAQRQLDRVEALEAAEVEHAQPFDRPAAQVADHLNRAGARSARRRRRGPRPWCERRRRGARCNRSTGRGGRRS